MNWGTTTEVLGGIGTKVAQKMGERKAAKKQETQYNSTGSGVDSALTGGSDDTPSYHKGGKVRKTGLARLKRGERVLTKPQQRKAGLLKKR